MAKREKAEIFSISASGDNARKIKEAKKYLKHGRRFSKIAVEGIIEKLEGTGVPRAALEAIVAAMDVEASVRSVDELLQILKGKAEELKALGERLSQLTAADPEVQRLRQAAVGQLLEGRFMQADACLAAAEERDLEGLYDLEVLVREKRLSAAKSRAERANAALLRANRQGYGQGASHFGEAARIAQIADIGVSRCYAHDKGWALIDLGRDFGSNGPLLEAIEHFRAMLRGIDQRNNANDWIKTHSNLGNALFRLGERESDTNRLYTAAEVCRAALIESGHESAPFDWAMAQNTLGNVLYTLGKRENELRHFDEAVTAFRAALEVRTREREPVGWAKTQGNLGNALLALGEREQGTATLREAVTAYRASLLELTREHTARDWAMAQNNMGHALLILAEKEKNKLLLQEALSALHAALEVRTQERFPLDWAMTQHNLGNVLAALSEYDGSVSLLRDALTAYNSALMERTRDRVPFDWAMTQHGLGNALAILGEREHNTVLFKESAEAYRAALIERNRNRVPFYWAMTQRNLASVLFALGQHEIDLVHLRKSIFIYNEILEADFWNKIQFSRSEILIDQGWVVLLVGCRTNDLNLIKKALEQLQFAFNELKKENQSIDFDLLQKRIQKARALFDNSKVVDQASAHSGSTG